MEILLMFFVVVAALAVAAVMFCVWATAAVVRGTYRLFVPPARPAATTGPQCCGNTDCRCDNPAYARFCRRCGRSLPALLRAVASRAAML